MAAKSSMDRSPVAILRRSFECFVKDEGFRMSAALAYYCAFSLAPLLLIAVAAAGAVFGDEAASGMLHDDLVGNFGTTVASVIQDMLVSARKPMDNLWVSICGFVLLMFGAAGVFREIQKTLNTIWNVSPRHGRGIRIFIRHRLLSFSMVLITGFLLLVSMLLTTLLQSLGNNPRIASVLPIASWIAGSGLLSFAITTALLAAIFNILPDTRIRWRDAWTGAFFTAMLFMIGKLAIGWYLGREATTSTYRAGGSFVVLLMWLYYSSMILYFGAEVTENIAHIGEADPEEVRPDAVKQNTPETPP